MNQPPETQPSPRHEYPYGHDYFLLGLRAVDALYDLCNVPDQSECEWGRWVDSDHWALDGWLNVEEKANIAFDDETVSASQARQVKDVLFRYHVALPFDEAERNWLYEAYKTAWGPNSISIIRRKEARVMTAGLRRVIIGRDLRACS